MPGLFNEPKRTYVFKARLDDEKTRACCKINNFKKLVVEVTGSHRFCDSQ